MESLLLSLSLIVVLAAFSSLVDTAAQVAVEWSQAGRQPCWTGADHPANRWIGALGRDWQALSHFGVQVDLQKILGDLICLLTTVLLFAVIPLAPPVNATAATTMIAADADVALLFVLAMLTLSVVGEVLVGTGRQRVDFPAEHFAFIAALGLSTIGVVGLSASWRIDGIVNTQHEMGIWWLARQPLGCAAMLLCLIWQMSRIKPTAQRGGDEAEALTNQTDTGTRQLAFRLQLIATTYLFVNFYLGGWQVWGVDLIGNDGGSMWIGWGVRFFTMHLKVALVLLWLIWLRFVRLQDVSMSACRRGLVGGALFAAILNGIVTEFSERYLASQPEVWKAGVAWSALFVVLIGIGVFSQRVMPD